MDMPLPDQRHQKLARLAGLWRGEELMPPSPWASGGKAIGIIENRVSLRGFALIQDYQQEVDHMPRFSGHGVFTVMGDEIILHWFDCMGGPANVFTGIWQGDTLSLNSVHGGMSSRCTFVLESENQYHFLMDMMMEKGQWKNMMTGHYRKQV